MQLEKAEKYIIELLRSKLPSNLCYHDLEHTYIVLKKSMEIAREENITEEHDLNLLKTAALYHDSGFINVYDNHEEESCRIAARIGIYVYGY